MRAIVQDTYGGPDVLALREVERPVIGDREVLVRVLAAGVDRGAWHFMTGRPYLMRVIGFGFRAPKMPAAGTNLAGRVEAVGEDVTRFRPGDEVYGTCRGAFAEYASAKEDKLAAKPSNLTFEQAAVVPHGGYLALQALRDGAEVQAGQTVLIIGASGAVGSMAVQVAKAFGAEVTGVCSTANVELVRSLGADHVVDYTHHDFADGTHRYDVVLDIAGNRPVSHLRRALAPRGRLLIAGGEGGGPLTGGLHRQVWAQLLSPFVRQKLGTFIAKERSRDLVALTELIEAGKVAPVLDRTYPLADAAQAMRDLEAGHAHGRIALTTV